MAPNHLPVSDTSPTPFHSRRKDRLSEDVVGTGLWENTRLGGNHHISRTAADRDDRGEVGDEMLMIGRVYVFYSAVETRRWERVRSRHGDDGRDIWRW